MTALVAARTGLLAILGQFGAQPCEDVAALADVLDLPEPVLAGLIEEMVEAGELERFAGALRVASVGVTINVSHGPSLDRLRAWASEPPVGLVRGEGTDHGLS